VAADAGRWGWHRLDRRWVDRLIDLAGVHERDLVLDIGAGDGAITSRLLDVGASVIAVELHAGRAATLRNRFAGQDVVVVRADAADLRLPRRPFRVVANPPFGITTAVLRRLTLPTSNLTSATIVVPAWAAARWAAGRGAGGVASKRLFPCSRHARVPASAFTPRPPADAAILVIRRALARR
jgi:23S rRNA (adenine-N6)-dimethyltransferase